MISEGTKAYLLSLARETMAARLSKQPLPVPRTAAELASVCGVFVTLHTVSGDLRGCIGYVEGVKPLAESVIDMAISAAFSDPRFEPVAASELTDIVIEITVLSPLRPVADLNDIVVGRHGLIASKGRNRGLLLPQVPVEHGWNRETFISHTCMKAGLMPDEWKKGTVTFESFEGEVFGEPRKKK